MAEMATVICENNGEADRRIIIDGKTYVLDSYALEDFIQALKTIKDVRYSKVIRSIQLEN